MVRRALAVTCAGLFLVTTSTGCFGSFPILLAGTEARSKSISLRNRFISPVAIRLRRSAATCSISGRIFSVPLPLCAEINNTGA